MIERHVGDKYIHPTPSILLLTDESSSMIGGIRPDAKNASGSMSVSGKDHTKELGLCSPSRAKKARNMVRESSMVTNPYQGKESNSVAQAIGAGPYLSPNQPEIMSAAARVVRTHHRGEKERRGARLTEYVGNNSGYECDTGPLRVQTPNSVEVEDDRRFLADPF